MLLTWHSEFTWCCGPSSILCSLGHIKNVVDGDESVNFVWNPAYRKRFVSLFTGHAWDGIDPSFTADVRPQQPAPTHCARIYLYFTVSDVRDMVGPLPSRHRPHPREFSTPLGVGLMPQLLYNTTKLISSPDTPISHSGSWMLLLIRQVFKWNVVCVQCLKWQWLLNYWTTF